MKKITIALAVVLACGSAIAQQAPVQNDRHQQHQQQREQHRQQREQQHQQRFEQRKAVEAALRKQQINVLETTNGCASGATTPTAYRACEGQEKASRQALREERRGNREQHQAERGERMAHHQAEAGERRMKREQERQARSTRVE